MVQPLCRQLKEVARQYGRLKFMQDPNHLNSFVFNWALHLQGIRSRGWPGRVHETFNGSGVLDNADKTNSIQQLCSLISNTCQNKCKQEWFTDVQRVNAKRGQGQSKLRTYKLFKCEYEPEAYVIKVQSTQSRSAMARFRSGVAPINLEIGRFFNIPTNQRFCNFCPDCIEDESHVLLHCSMYAQLRRALFVPAEYFNSNFKNLNDTEKLIFLFSDDRMVFRCSRACNDISKTRKNAMTIIKH